MAEQFQLPFQIRIRMAFNGVPVEIPVSIGDDEDVSERLGDAIAFYKSKPGFSLAGDVSEGHNESRSRPVQQQQSNGNAGGCPKHGFKNVKTNQRGQYCATFETVNPNEAGWNEKTGNDGKQRWWCSWSSK